MNTSIVQIRKTGGLDKIVRDKNGTGLRPMLYHSDTKNRDLDGTLEGDYRGKTILDTKHFISPMWNDLKKCWSFEGSDQDLARLVDKMKLRYPKGHIDEGKVIKMTSPAAEMITNRQDEIFNHPSFYGKFYMENGRISLDMANPVHEFLYRCYKGDTSVRDNEGDKPVSKYFAASAKYELVSPKNENMKAKRDADKEIEAIRLLAAMDGNEEKMRTVAAIMQLPLYSASTDINGLFILLKDAAQNTSTSSKYQKTYQDRFIELAKLPDDELNVSGQVMLAKTKGVLRKRKDHYLLNGERLDGITTDAQLMSYFRNPKNQEQYIKLVDLLD